MFASVFDPIPEKEVARKQLRTHVAIFGAVVAVVRITPYILHYFSHAELKLEL